MLRPLVLALCLLALPASAETLADLRADLAGLSAELTKLRAELLEDGDALVSAGGPGALDRINALETALVELTAQAEAIDFRVRRGLGDITLRAEDLEFRLCEIEPECDPDLLGDGGTEVVDTGPSLAVGEEGDFTLAKESFETGDFASAVDQFSRFLETYPATPFGSEARVLLCNALTELGDSAPAARAYLASFSSDPNGVYAAESLFRLGASLRDLGQRDEACVTLGQVASRYPTSDFVGEAQAAYADLGCQ